MKKILITSSYFFPYLSGLTTYPYRLAKHWLKEGYQVNVLTFKYKEGLKSTETVEGIKIERLDIHLQLSKGLINFFYPYFAFRSVLRTDIVLVNLPGPENLWPSLFAKLLGKKLIALYHCDLDLKANFFLRVASFITNTSSYISCLFSNKIVNSSKNYAKTSPVLSHFLPKIDFQAPLINYQQPDKLYSNQLKKLYEKRC